ncbi:helix-turn-helix domain-containing protein [Nonomuraea sp. NPDC004580]|uniref:TetR/AcrR family transcriptional regulator n=1 Tax=Nonomuraea sp. NPDC004580 TaxID=3154552 RepID=UPI0033BBD48B
MRKRRRVPAMAPEDRRAALIAATLPLLREHGTAVSTRKIAEAAGVAEGTIFGVFPDKASLVRATLMHAFDPRPAVERIQAVGTETDLRTRLSQVVKLVRAGMKTNERLHAGVGEVAMRDKEFAEHLLSSRRHIADAVAGLMEPDRDRLRRSPKAAAHLLLMLIAVSTQAKFGPAGDEFSDMDDDEIVSVLLDGLLVRPSPTPFTESTS